MKNRRGSSIGEYLIILVLIAVAVIGATYAYHKYFVKKSFETAIESLDKEQSVPSDFMEEQTSKPERLKLAAPMFLAVLTFIVFLVIIFSTINAARKSKRKIKDLRDDEDGQAMTEFILIFPLQLFITLCIMQLSLIYTARLVVNYAAFNAARAACVIIPETREGEVAGHINLPKNEENSNEESSNTSNNSEEERPMTKFKDIKRAAALSLMPICQGSKAFLGDVKLTFFGEKSYTILEILDTIEFTTVIDKLCDFISIIGDVFGVNDLDKYSEAVFYRYIYSQLFTNIEILDTDMNVIYDEKDYSRSNLVVVRVKFPYYLVIPIADRFMGKRFNDDMLDYLGVSNDIQEYLGYADNQYFSLFKIECSSYVFPISAECAMHVEMKAPHEE